MYGNRLKQLKASYTNTFETMVTDKHRYFKNLLPSLGVGITCLRGQSNRSNRIIFSLIEK